MPETASPGMLQVFSSLMSRLALSLRLGDTSHGARRLHQVLGYKPSLTYRDYKARYVRQDMANRLVGAYPEATWAQLPTLSEDNDETVDTPFEQAWQALATRRALKLYAKLEQVDLLATLGRYAVLVLGLAGQNDLAQPATRVRGPDEVLYVTAYSEEFAHIMALDNDAASPRFGLPRLYRLDTSRGHAPGSGQRTVHASRVIHVVTRVLDDDVYGVPWLEPGYDRLDELLKVIGGGAEQCWRDAKRRIALEARDGFVFGDDDAQAMTQAAEAFTHDLVDFIKVRGVDVKTIAGAIASPRDHVDVILEMLSAYTGIPKRILVGNEAGSLASEQDEHAWLSRVARRQVKVAEPQILCPFVEACMALGVLPEPAQSYTVLWPNVLALSKKDQATVAKDVATAANTYAPGLADTVITTAEFREHDLGLKPIPDAPVVDGRPGPEEL